MIRLVENMFSDKQWEWRNDPRVYMTCRQNGPISQQEHRDWLSHVPLDKTCRYWGIEVDEGKSIAGLRKKPVIVGYCGLSDLQLGCKQAHRRAEYSILIGPEHQGKGYAKKALNMMLQIAFTEMGLHLVWGEIIENNTAGVEIAKKAGFTVDGKLRDMYWKGQWLGAYRVSITDEEYFGRRAA